MGENSGESRDVKYKLIYFDAKVLGEPIRQILYYLGIPFEDCRVDTSTWVEETRNSFKWHQLPELHIIHEKNPAHSKVLTQATAICRYLANSYPSAGLMPSDPWEKAKCDQIVDIVQDMRLRLKPYLLVKIYDATPPPDSSLDKMKSQLYEEGDFLLYLSNLNGLLEEGRQKQNMKEGKADYILGQKLSWADFFLANFTSIWEQVLEDEHLLESCPLLKKQQEAMNNVEKIKEWIEKRKGTSC